MSSLTYDRLVELALERPELRDRIAVVAAELPTYAEHARLRVQGRRASVVNVHVRLVSAANDWCAQSGLCHGHLGIPRAQMPQIESRRVQAFLSLLRDRGIFSRHGYEAVGKLRATQREISAEKVEGMVESARSGDGAFLTRKPVVVSSEGYILDGHHRWAACVMMDPSMKMPVYKVDLPIRELLDLARRFKGVTFKGIDG